MSVQLPVMESFFTIQGEGYHTGSPAHFIRFGGCDVGCVWCDVKESWDADAHPSYTTDQLLEQVNGSSTDLIVLTGGEPAMYDLTELNEKLKFNKKTIAIETSGCYALKGEVDWYTFSPKKFKKPDPEAYQKANELKVVIYHKSDLEWAMEHAQKVRESCLLYLQPEWSKMEELMEEIVEFTKRNKGWKISLQTHKFMNIP